MKKRIFVGFFAVICVLTLASVSVFAADAGGQEKPSGEVYTEWEYVNPRYENLNIVLAEEEAWDVWSAKQGKVEYIGSEEEIVSAIRENFVNRNQSFRLYYRTTESDIDFKKLWAAAKDHTGNPKEGDSLLAAVGRISGKARGYYDDDGMCCWTLDFTVAYDATDEQELLLDQKVAEVLKKLNLQNKTDYGKVLCIYDYICDNVTYDYDHLGDSSYRQQFSAYAALVEGTAVCEGYAALFYRLALEAGLDARMIIYTSQSGGHAWNIVRIGELYYNVDSTWDSALYHCGYDYFLRCDANFKDHTPDAKYMSSEFCTQYPKSENDYKTLLKRGYCGDSIVWELYDNGEVAIYGEGAVDDYETAEESPLWKYRDQIRTVSIKDDVTRIGDWFFSGCSELREVTIPASVTAIGKSAFSVEGLNDVCFLGDAPAVADDTFGSTVKVWYDPTASGWSPPEWNGLRAHPFGTDLSRNGLHIDENGIWKYYVDGVVDTGFTGLVEYEGRWYYVVNGAIDFGYMGLVQHVDTNWYYVVGGAIQEDYTGLVQHTDGVWYYAENGGLNFTYTGLVEYGGSYFYVTNGVLDWGYTGATEYGDATFFVTNGSLVWGLEGLHMDNNGVWYNLSNSVVTTDLTGLVQYGSSWYYVVNGIVDFGYMGLIQHVDTAWYFVVGGCIQFDYTGLVQHTDTRWYYAENGCLNFGFTGLVEYYGSTFYVTGGCLNWGFSGTVDGKNVVDGAVVG